MFTRKYFLLYTYRKILESHCKLYASLNLLDNVRRREEKSIFIPKNLREKIQVR